MNTLRPLALTTLTGLLAFSGAAFAQENAQPGAGTQPGPRPNVILIKEKRADLKEAAKNVRTDFKTGSKDLRADTKTKIKTATTSGERREIGKNFIEKKKELIDTRKAGTAVIKDQKKELARKHVGIIEQRYSVAIKQFDGLLSRIESRIAKLKAGGADVSHAEAALVVAQTAVAKVKTDAQALADLRAQVNSGEDAKTLRAQIEAAVKKVGASIKAAHTALEKAGKVLAAIDRPLKPAATSTPETN